MKLHASSRFAVFCIANLSIYSLAVVARPTSRSSVTPLGDLSLFPFFGTRSCIADEAFEAFEALSTPSPPAVATDTYCSPLDSDANGTPTLIDTRYDEQVVLRFNITSRQEAAELTSLSTALLFDVWESNANWVDLRLPRTSIPQLLEHLPVALQYFTPLLDGPALLRAIEASYPSSPDSILHDGAEAPFMSETSNTDLLISNVFFQEYRPLRAMKPWMQMLQSIFPDFVRLISIGKSYEGREIHALRIGARPDDSGKNGEPRKTIVISGGMHAREWIGISTVNFVAYSFINGYGKYMDITSLVQDFDWVFIPTVNPDGYAYTWSNNRLWRKTRQHTSSSLCVGLDLDRTFDYKWDGQDNNPCSETYAGEASFEAVEARALANWAKNETAENKAEFVGFIDFHSYSQQILYPYSYSCVEEPPTLENLEELGSGLAKAIHLGGELYQVTSACEASVMSENNAGGSALDWFYQEMRIRRSFQIKLRDNGVYGFLLPREYITPTGREMVNAAKHLGLNLQSLYFPEREQGLDRMSNSQTDSSFLSSDTQKPLE